MQVVLTGHGGQTLVLPVRLPTAPTTCPDCGLHAGRDALSAVLASCVDFIDPTDPAAATVDYSLTGRLLDDGETRGTLHQT